MKNHIARHFDRMVYSNFQTVNPGKTQALTLGSLNYDYTLQLNNTVLEVEDTLKILGVTIDKNLSFKEHLKGQLKKAYAKCSALRKKMVGPKTMIRLYKAYILSSSILQSDPDWHGGNAK